MKLFVLCSLAAVSFGLRTGRVRIKSSAPFVFAQRFCFGTRGKLTWTLEGPAKLLFYAEDQLIDDQRVSTASDLQKMLSSTALTTISTSGHYAHRSSAPRWFYVALYSPRGVDLECSFHFTNGEWGEVSWDEVGLFAAAILFFVLFSGLACLGAVTRSALSSRDALYPAPRLLLWSILANFTSSLFSLVHHVLFLERKGKLPSPVLLRAAVFSASIADVLLFFVLLFCALGWKIVRRKLPGATRIRIAVFGSTYFCATLFHFFHPNLLLFLLRCAGGTWIVSACLARNYDVLLFYSSILWTLSAPVTLFVASIVADTERHKIETVLPPTLSFVAQLALVYWFDPNFNQRSFPFHPKQRRIVTAAGQNRGNLPTVSGGRSRDVNARGNYQVRDAFETLHVRRLLRVQAALESKLVDLRLTALELKEFRDD